MSLRNVVKINRTAIIGLTVNYIAAKPKPNDASVSITTSPEEYVAVIQFGGYANDAEIKQYANHLESALKANHIEYFGNFRFLGYNAPFQFIARKNEVVVNVKWKLIKL